MARKSTQSLHKCPAAALNTKKGRWTKDKQLQAQRETYRKSKEAAEKKKEERAKYNSTQAARKGAPYNAGARTSGDVGERMCTVAAS